MPRRARLRRKVTTPDEAGACVADGNNISTTTWPEKFFGSPMTDARGTQRPTEQG